MEPLIIICPWETPNLVHSVTLYPISERRDGQYYRVNIPIDIAEQLVHEKKPANVSVVAITDAQYVIAEGAGILDDFYLLWKTELLRQCRPPISADVVLVLCNTTVADDIERCFDDGVDEVLTAVFIPYEKTFQTVRIRIFSVEKSYGIEFIPVWDTEVISPA